jgi:4-carboxymuconolactone decarboxylase
MTRVAYLKPEEADGELRRALELVPKKLMATMAQAQGPAPISFALISSLLSDTNLDPMFRELAIMHVGAASKAEYEWVQHEPIARANGVSAKQLAAIEMGDLSAACFGPREGAILAYANAVLANGRPSDDTFEALRSVVGLEDREIVELTLVVAFYRALAYVMVALEIDIDPPNDDDQLGNVLQALAGEGN